MMDEGVKLLNEDTVEIISSSNGLHSSVIFSACDHNFTDSACGSDLILLVIFNIGEEEKN